MQRLCIAAVLKEFLELRYDLWLTELYSIRVSRQSSADSSSRPVTVTAGCRPPSAQTAATECRDNKCNERNCNENSQCHTAWQFHRMSASLPLDSSENEVLPCSCCLYTVMLVIRYMLCHCVLISNAVVTCEIKLFWNNFEIISVFYFTCNHHSWLHVKYNAEIISKYFSVLFYIEPRLKLK